MVIFRAFIIIIFLISPEKNSKTSKVYQQSVLNILLFSLKSGHENRF